MTGYSNDHIASLVRPDQVHRDVYEDPDLFDLEMDGFSAGLGYMSVTRARSRNRAISSVPGSASSRLSCPAIRMARCMLCTTGAPTAA